MVSLRSTLVVLIGAAALASCDQIAGPGVSDGQTTILLNQTADAQIAAYAITDNTTGAVAFHGGPFSGAKAAMLESIDVTIVAVQAQPIDSLGEFPKKLNFSNWKTLTFETPITVDLLSLPADSTGGLVIASGDLPLGSYGRLRVLVSEAQVVLNEPLVIRGDTIPAGQPIDVMIPDPWIKVPGATFSVAETGATVAVQFDPETSFANLVITGSGRIQFTPVFRGHRWQHDWLSHSDYQDDHSNDGPGHS
jgi:hypothetical protein